MLYNSIARGVDIGVGPGKRGSGSPRRSGVVLLAVLIVLVLLSLVAYNYSDLMTEEYKGSDNFHKAAQVRAFADSGIHFALAALSDPDTVNGLLGGNPYDNPSVFRAHSVSVGNVSGFFSLVAPMSSNTTGANGSCQYGVVDEGGKININALMVMDPTGKKLYNMLMLLPNMTDEIANSIIDWVDADSTPLAGGAESDYYSGLSPPYSAKNAPLDSIEELLLVKGVTPQLLFGDDINRNGYQDVNESSSGGTPSGGFDRGWSAYLTCYSREQNLDPTGQPLIYLNDKSADPATLYANLSSKLGNDDLAKFIVMVLQLGGTAPTSTSSTSVVASVTTALRGTTTSSSSSSSTQTGVISSYQLDTTKPIAKTVNSLFDLITNTVQIKTTVTQGKTTKTVTTVYNSPLADPTQQAALLPLLFQSCTIFPAIEIPARVNINTATPEVLTALPGLTSADVQAIMAMQPQYASSDVPLETFQTPAWLITQANISPSKLSKLEPYITTRSQVYRVQSLGYFNASKGPVARIEAYIDTNPVYLNGTTTYQPRILSWRDMDKYGHVRPPE